ncbi:hypothetical protein THASP1DRAFT_31103 [Thamnocephalis sphaerospora]|uniref:Uncharacterized protein n=1 Tax=Thamnocephalis sphaerospora TaxID=78915 RepID=A0A4V1IWC6_9FUNG|nr:hypothetical protein THASP1DRAFT_31103 [Thamnocephalis sphaerospora]|eukprot:RKP07089.1 hypothetical protein THASP1DRAFT_31103 [Thamnocephalis sphaerospora]
MYKKHLDYVRSQRIDDSRLVIWTDYNGEPDDATAPTLALLGMDDGPAGASLTKKWSYKAVVWEIQSIATHNILVLKQPEEVVNILSLADGSEVRRALLGCWSTSGLYPPDKQWANMSMDSEWQCPKIESTPTEEDAQEDEWGIAPTNYADTEPDASPTALLINKDGVFTVLDFSAFKNQNKACHWD